MASAQLTRSPRSQHFPARVEDLLTPIGVAMLKGEVRDRRALFSRKRAPLRYASFPDVVDPVVARRMRSLLDKRFYPLVKKLDMPIPNEATWGIRKNRTEALPNVMRMKFTSFIAKNKRTIEVGQETGLLPLLASPELKDLASRISGLPLRRPVGMDVLCYEEGDYIGPHTDYYPEDPNGAHGYVALNFSFANEGVKHQWLVYERDGHMSGVGSGASPHGFSINRLPFWHQMTALTQDETSSVKARRWVVLVSYNVAPTATP